MMHPQYTTETDVRATYRVLASNGFLSPARSSRKRPRENDENLDPALLSAPPTAATTFTQAHPSPHDIRTQQSLQPKPPKRQAMGAAQPGASFPMTRQAPAFASGGPETCASSMLGAWVQSIGTSHHLAARAQRVCVDLPGRVAADLLAASLPQNSRQQTVGILSELFHIACSDPVSQPGAWCAEVLTHLLQEPSNPMASWLTQAGAVSHILLALQRLQPAVDADSTRACVLLALLRQALDHGEPSDHDELEVCSVVTRLCQGYTFEASEAALQTLCLRASACYSSRLTASFQHHIGLYLHKAVMENSPWAARLLRALSDEDESSVFPDKATAHHPLSETRRRLMVCGLLRSYSAAPALLSVANISRLAPSHRECLLRIALDIVTHSGAAVAFCRDLKLPTALHYLRRVMAQVQWDIVQRERAKQRKATATLRLMR